MNHVGMWQSLSCQRIEKIQTNIQGQMAQSKTFSLETACRTKQQEGSFRETISNTRWSQGTPWCGKRNTEAAEIIAIIRPGMSKTLLVRTSSEKKINPLKINIHVKVVSTVQDIWQAFNKYLKLKLKFRRIPAICSSQLVRTTITLNERTARRHAMILKDQERGFISSHDYLDKDLEYPENDLILNCTWVFPLRN